MTEKYVPITLYCYQCGSELDGEGEKDIALSKTWDTLVRLGILSSKEREARGIPMWGYLQCPHCLWAVTDYEKALETRQIALDELMRNP